METQPITKEILEIIFEMNENELIQLNNEYCQSANYRDDEIYENDEHFFATYFENDIIGAVKAVSYGSYNYSHNYVKFNGYGNLESFSYFTADDLCENVEIIAEYIAENLEDFSQFDNLEENL